MTSEARVRRIEETVNLSQYVVLLTIVNFCKVMRIISMVLVMIFATKIRKRILKTLIWPKTSKRQL